MNIGVDGGALAVGNKNGYGVYQVNKELLKALVKIDTKNNYSLYSFAPIVDDFGPRFEKIDARPARGWRYFGLPRQLILRKPDIFLGLNQALPCFVRLT